MVEHGLPEPEFIQEQDFRIVIYRYTPQAAVQVTPQVTEQDKVPESTAVKNLIPNPKFLGNRNIHLLK